MNKTKILHIITGKTFSGEEEKLYFLCKYYNKERIEPHVAVLSDSLLAKLLREAGIEVHVIPMESRIDLRAAIAVARLAKRLKIDILVSHTGRTAILARLAHLLCGSPTVTILTAPILRDTNSLTPKKWNFRFERWTSRWTARYAVANKDIGEELIRHGEDPSKISLIYNAIDFDEYREFSGVNGTLKNELGLKEDSNLVGMLAAFRPRKGTEYLIKAIPRIIEKAPDTWFVFVGHGDWVDGKDYIQVLKELAASLGVDSRVIFPGFRRDIPNVLNSLDLFVLPSLFGEGSSLAIMEGMALELPVVSTITEGNKEVVEDGVTGLLVPPADENALAEAITAVLADKELAGRMGSAGMERADRMFRADDMARNYEKVYEEILSSGSG